MAFVALVLQPCLLATTDILLRKLKKIRFEVWPFYQSLMILCLAGTQMLFAGTSFGYVYEMEGRTWLYLMLSCVFYILGSSTKAIAI